MIYIVGISIAFFLSLLLISKKRKTQADKILTCWLLVIGIHLLLYYLVFSGVAYHYPFLLGLNMPLPLVHGPFLFLYTASLTNQLTGNKKIWLLHFIPAAASWLYLIKFFILPASQKIFIFQHKGVGYEIFQLINLAAIVISGIAYVACCTILLNRHRKAILNQFSYTEKINLRWLQYLVYWIAFIWLLIFAKDEILFTGVVLFVLFMGYFGIRQVGIFTTQHVNGQLPPTSADQTAATVQPATGNQVENSSLLIEPDLLEPGNIINGQAEMPGASAANTEKKKYSKSGLTATMAENLHSRLTRLMNTEKLYTESELSLSELADRLGTLPNYLSQVINEKEGSNFYDYINTLRIEEFKRMITIPENKKYTLVSLSYDCGFNSKSSFNKNFKKATGQSPTAYLNSLNLQTA